MDRLELATRLRRYLSIAKDKEHIKTPANVRLMRHAQLHTRRILERLNVKTDPSQPPSDQQECSSIVCVISEEDVMLIIKELENDPRNPRR